MAIVLGDTFKVRLLRAKLAVLGNVILRIYTEQVIVNGGLILDQFTEATYPGYSPIFPVRWGQPFLRPDGKAEVRSELIRLRMTGDFPANALWGYYVEGPLETFAWADEFNPAPVAFLFNGSSHDFYIYFNEDTLR